MARVKLSGLLSDIGGSVGGSTFSRSSYGLSLSNKSFPTPKFSPAQMLCRTNLSELQSTWHLLDGAWQLQWEKFSTFKANYSRHNKSSLLSGYNLFFKYNLMRLSAGLPILLQPAYSQLGGQSYKFRTTRISGNLTLVFESDLNIEQSWVLFKIGPAYYFTNPASFRRLRVLVLPLNEVNNFNIMSLYNAIFPVELSTGAQMGAECTFFSMVAPVFSEPVKRFVVYAET